MNSRDGCTVERADIYQQGDIGWSGLELAWDRLDKGLCGYRGKCWYVFRVYMGMPPNTPQKSYPLSVQF